MEFGRRESRALAPLLLAVAVALLSLLAFNLRNLDAGAEQLPPVPVQEPTPECALGYGPNCPVEEGIGTPLRALFVTIILTFVILTVAGIVYAVWRGVKVWRLVSRWELLGYALAVFFLAAVLLFYAQISGGLQALLKAAGADGTGGSGGSGGTNAPSTTGTAATFVVLLAAGIVTVFLVVFGYHFFSKVYSIATYEAPDVGRSKRELARAVRTAIQDLESGGDFRAAVLRCYKSMVLLFQTRGLRADPSQTAREFEADALRSLGVSREGVDDLTSLFEEARYSRHAIGEPQRDAALDSLRAIRGQLEGAA